jgi:TetR/AcrR family transcriptional regulator
MGTPKQVLENRKKREKDLRIENIIEAAKRIFVAKGYLNTTMDEIALEVEISKPTLYQYFKNKDDLYFLLLIPLMEELERCQIILEKKLLQGKYSSGTLFVRDIFRGFYKTYEKDPGLFTIFQMVQQTGIIWGHSDNTKARFADTWRRYGDLNRRILKIAMDQGLIREMDPYSLACILWGLFTGIVQLEQQKSKGKKTNGFLKKNLKMAVELITLSLIPQSGRVVQNHSIPS